jgi:hypothetical protein
MSPKQPPTIVTLLYPGNIWLQDALPRITQLHTDVVIKKRFTGLLGKQKNFEREEAGPSMQVISRS